MTQTERDPNAKTLDGWPRLVRAAFSLDYRTERVRALLATPGINVNATNENGKTALMYAARDNDGLKELLMRGLQPYSQKNRDLIIWQAASSCDSDILRLAAWNLEHASKWDTTNRCGTEISNRPNAPLAHLFLAKNTNTLFPDEDIRTQIALNLLRVTSNEVFVFKAWNNATRPIIESLQSNLKAFSQKHQKEISEDAATTLAELVTVMRRGQQHAPRLG